ncbi:MAG: hypothetical protein EOO27_01070 [Comamonadaceae bacterium]|nr:MAG: hypothetical protein EOO27_01070 [Comamonadaceae bacterium]
MSSGSHHVITQAIRAHWAAHQNAYPQRIVLTPAQHDDLIRLVTIGRAGQAPADRDTFQGCKIDRQEGAQAVLIAANDAEVLLDL